MTHVLLFHHAQGLTPGVQDFAAQLRSAGHEVTVPDLFEGATFDSLDAGVAHASEIGFDTVLQRGARAAQALPEEVVYAGFSLGVMPAQMLAQTRPRARGVLLMHACVPPAEFGTPWPMGLPVQVHGMDADPFFVGEGDVVAARELVANSEHGELFLYPGDGHLFADPGLRDYDADAAALLTRRVLAFLDGSA